MSPIEKFYLWMDGFPQCMIRIHKGLETMWCANQTRGVSISLFDSLFRTWSGSWMLPKWRVCEGSLKKAQPSIWQPVRSVCVIRQARCRVSVVTLSYRWWRMALMRLWILSATLHQPPLTITLKYSAKLYSNTWSVLGSYPFSIRAVGQPCKPEACWSDRSEGLCEGLALTVALFRTRIEPKIRQSWAELSSHWAI